MANPIKGEVDLKVGDRTFTLALGINEIVKIEKDLDVGVVEIGNWFSNPARLRALHVRACLWAALQRHHADVSIEAVGELVQEIGLQAAVAKIGEALQASFPPAEAGRKNPRAASAGTGRRSS